MAVRYDCISGADVGSSILTTFGHLTRTGQFPEVVACRRQPDSQRLVRYAIGCPQLGASHDASAALRTENDLTFG